MTAVALRRAMSGPRRRFAVALALLSIGGAVAVHHAAPADMSSMAGHAICLAVLGAGLLAAGGVGVKRLRAAAPARPVLRLMPVTLVVLAPRSVAARAGPIYLRLRVLRI
jgi:hypothetical protein